MSQPRVHAWFGLAGRSLMDAEKDLIKDLIAMIDELTEIIERTAPEFLEDLEERGAALYERAGQLVGDDEGGS